MRLRGLQLKVSAAASVDEFHIDILPGDGLGTVVLRAIHLLRSVILN